MKRIRFIPVVLTLLALAAVHLVGCSRDSGPITRVASPRYLVVGGALPATVNLDELVYEELSGTLEPGVGGLMGRYLSTWPKNSWFSLIVPPDAIAENGAPVAFKLRVPNKDSYLAHPELDSTLVIRLEPEGVYFADTLTVQGTWMPWRPAPTGSTLKYYSGADSGLARVEYIPSTNRYRVTFAVSHFSDWEIGPKRRNP